jgi:ATP-dependent Clp protease ATP-binding subunit ClpX
MRGVFSLSRSNQPTTHLQSLACSFCGKSDAHTRVISGPDVGICAECVDLCVEMLGEDVGAESS